MQLLLIFFFILLQSHAGKVVERHWYEKNKHIFPASRWEVNLFSFKILFHLALSSNFKAYRLYLPRNQIWQFILMIRSLFFFHQWISSPGANNTGRFTISLLLPPDIWSNKEMGALHNSWGLSFDYIKFLDGWEDLKHK